MIDSLSGILEQAVRVTKETQWVVCDWVGYGRFLWLICDSGWVKRGCGWGVRDCGGHVTVCELWWAMGRV